MVQKYSLTPEREKPFGETIFQKMYKFSIQICL